MPDPDPPSSPPETAPFGARFYSSLRRFSGTSGSLNYETIQRLKESDRDQTIDLLRERAPQIMTYRTIQLMKECEPEELAKLLTFEMAAANAHAGQAALYLALFT